MATLSVAEVSGLRSSHKLQLIICQSISNILLAAEAGDLRHECPTVFSLSLRDLCFSLLSPFPPAGVA